MILNQIDYRNLIWISVKLGSTLCMSCSNAGVQGQQRGSSILLCRWHDKWSKSILPLLGSHWIERNEGLFYLTCPPPAQARRWWRWAKTTGLLAGYYNQSAKRLAQGLQIFWPWLLSSRTFRPLLFLFGLALILGNFLGYLPSFYLDIWLLWILHTLVYIIMLLCIQGIFSFFFLKQTLVPWLCVLIQRIVYHAMLLHYNHIVYAATT